MKFTLQPRLFLYLVLSFIAATIIGTITHELGHIAVAKMLGYKTELHYGSMVAYDSSTEIELEDKHKKEHPIDSNLISKYNHEQVLIIFGGPLQTIATGTIGFLLLWVNRKRIKSSLTAMQWFFVFLAFFWSRQIFNFLLGVFYYLRSGRFALSDEDFIRRHYKWNPWAIDIIGSFIAAILLAIVVFKLIPKQQRFTFLCSGITGSIIGFIFWMKILGPVILP